MKDLINIDALALLIQCNCHPCSTRTAWTLVNKNPRIISRIKRGGKFVFFKRQSALRLCNAINDGRAKR